VSGYVEVQSCFGQPEGDQDHGQKEGQEGDGGAEESCGGQEALKIAVNSSKEIRFKKLGLLFLCIFLSTLLFHLYYCF